VGVAMSKGIGSAICCFKKLRVQPLRISLTLLLFVTLLPLSLFGQTTGTIVGRVSDPTGVAVASGTVTAKNVDTGLVRTARINDGEYFIPSLPIGSYQITVQVAGFKEFSQTGITLQVGQNARVDAALQLGTVTESVSVSAAALSVDTTSTIVGAAIDNKQLEDIPLNGRNALGLAQLLPGVGTASLPEIILFSRGGPTFTVSGSRTSQNNVMLDGTTLIGAMGNVAQNLPDPDALQEFRIFTNTFSAEYGRASGGVLLAVTKSGTNSLHGSLWEFLRNDSLNARNYFNGPSTGPRPFLRQNQFGGSIGGPVVLPGYNGKGKTFFFVNYQGLRISQQSDNTSILPTAAELNGDFSGQAPIIDPLTGLQFPGNIIPTARLDPLALGESKAFLPVNPTNGPFLQLFSQPSGSNQITVKVDQKLSNADNLNFRFYRDKDSASNVGGAPSQLLGGVQATRIVSYALNETHIFNAGLLNELHYSYTQPNSVFVASKNNKTPMQLGGLFNQDGSIPLAPTVIVPGFFTLGPLFPLVEPDELNQYDEKFSWIHGRHAMKFGAQYLHIHHETYAQFQTSLDFTFDGSFTGNPMADFILGRSQSLFTQSLDTDYSKTSEYEFFAQDDFKVNRRLTLNFGLRYELDTPYVQVPGGGSPGNETSSIRPFVGCTLATCEQSKIFPTAPPGLVFPGDAGVPLGLIPADKTNFAPRFGFAFDPAGNGHTSIRGAFATFYDYTGAIVSSTVNQTLPYLIPLSVSAPPSFSNPWQGTTDPYPFAFNASNPTFLFPTQAYSVSPNFKNGYIDEFNLNVQHQLGSDYLIQMGYYGKLGRKLSDDHEANPALYGPGATEANVQSRRPFFPQYYGSIGLITSDANSSYHSLQSSIEKKFSHGYKLQVAYTYSHSIDDRSIFSVDGVSGADPLGQHYLTGERGSSDFDQRHLLAINGVWELPFLRHNGVLTTAFGGWELSGVARYGSGLPFNAVSAQDYALEGGGRGTAAERPNIVGDPTLPGGRGTVATITEYFNTAAFSAPAPGQYGNEGRNIMIGPAFFQADMAVLKHFPLPKEAGRFEFRLEFFNIFNNVNFDTPNSTFGSPAFGQIQSAEPARIIQLGLRYDF